MKISLFSNEMVQMTEWVELWDNQAEFGTYSGRSGLTISYYATWDGEHWDTFKILPMMMPTVMTQGTTLTINISPPFTKFLNRKVKKRGTFLQ